ncbi:catechol 2,3-dioxygenase [Peribacillus cavernae]|uniref:Metapyrocatechase n=1 Tax=Peribacillus cavernae TaxID=1674310 RepID=A0A433HX58_9BACI|nr:catechol 2,3-dioxygenase [Peribacillus cavernae]MDQ0218020.1 catechol 2,3-dioxygenase [Peribacillus cavernae]RUQ32814.1 catechol 2,3-dioxygenase [Peribacillus cavernae]
MSNFDVAQLAHVELFSPKPEDTVRFFTQFMGLQVTETKGQSVYLRAYEDFYHHTLKITEAKEAGMAHSAWRASSEAALYQRVQSLEKSGYGKGWIDGDLGHGQAYQFQTPDGHNMEILWDVEYYKAPEDQKTKLKSRPQKRPNVGIPARRLDHINLMCSNVTQNKNFMADELGFKLRENILMNDGLEMGAWMSVSPLVHEIALMKDLGGAKGRFHHIAYWYGYPQHLMDLADLLVENDIVIEAGPGKHGVSQAYFMYVFEPGGNRVEMFGDAGYLILDPDWKPVTWKEEELDKGIIWYGSPLPEEYFLYGTPDNKVSKVILK